MKPRLADENRRRKTLWLLGAIGAFSIVTSLIITAAVAWSFYPIRASAKWSMWSHRYKSEVLAQPEMARELKHIDWDGWGWAGQDTNVYLVFDSTDSLSMAGANRASGKFNGIPCEVAQVHQLESHWYTVQFYTNEFWGRRNALDCTGFGR